MNEHIPADADWQWFILGPDGEPTPECDRDKVEAFIKDGPARLVAETRVGTALIHTVFKPCLYPVDFPEWSKDRWWETLIEGGSEMSIGAPDLDWCGGPRALAERMHARHIAIAKDFLGLTETPV